MTDETIEIKVYMSWEQGGMNRIMQQSWEWDINVRDIVPKLPDGYEAQIQAVREGWETFNDDVRCEILSTWRKLGQEKIINTIPTVLRYKIAHGDQAKKIQKGTVEKRGFQPVEMRTYFDTLGNQIQSIYYRFQNPNQDNE